MSLPATATWQYNWKPDEDSDEAKFSKVIYQPLDWAAMSATDVEKLISGS
jgi:coproporphyrinogen III oxidase